MYLFKYKQTWPDEFQKEKQLINSFLDMDLHHIGSTAIKGLYAKDCIDILGIINSKEDFKHSLSDFEHAAYEYRGEYGIKGREYLVKHVRKVHLHIYKRGDPNIEKHLNFVDKMRTNQALIDELNHLKLSLHNKYPDDKNSYQIEKKRFYDKIHSMY